MNPLNLGDSAVAAATDADGEVITAGVSTLGAAQAFLSGLGAYQAANILVTFNYVGGGTELNVIVETSFDQGATWVEVYRAVFTTSGGQRIINVSGLTPKTTPLTPVTLSDNTVTDGLFGDCWRARKIVEGTYTGNSNVSVRMQPR